MKYKLFNGNFFLVEKGNLDFKKYNKNWRCQIFCWFYSKQDPQQVNPSQVVWGKAFWQGCLKVETEHKIILASKIRGVITRVCTLGSSNDGRGLGWLQQWQQLGKECHSCAPSE